MNRDERIYHAINGIDRLAIFLLCFCLLILGACLLTLAALPIHDIPLP